MQGKMIIVSAPSGAGKSTIVKYLLKQGLKLEFSISACSREKRAGEKNGKDYYFLTPDEFRKRIENNDFLEWEEVYPGSYYGTLKSEVDRIWQAGNHVVFDVDVVGGVNIKQQYPKDALALFIMPPDIGTLRNRLMKRGTENNESLEKRVGKAEKEITFADKFDRIIVNDDLDRACRETLETVKDFLEEN